MNMEEIYKIETIEQYNNMYGFKTMHPLVASDSVRCDGAMSSVDERR